MISLAIYAFIISICLAVLFFLSIVVVMNFFLKIPTQFQWEELNEEQVSRDAATAFKNVEKELAPLNFTAIKTYVNKGYNIENINRLYYHADSAAALVALFAGTMGSTATTLEFVTWWEDGKNIQTVGFKDRKVAFAPRLQIVSALLDVKSAAGLYEKHLKKVESKKASGVGIRYLRPDRVMEEMINDHNRGLENRVKEGRLIFDPQKNAYRVSIIGTLGHLSDIFKTSSDLWDTKRLAMLVVGFFGFYILIFLFLLEKFKP